MGEPEQSREEGRTKSHLPLGQGKEPDSKCKEIFYVAYWIARGLTAPDRLQWEEAPTGLSDDFQPTTFPKALGTAQLALRTSGPPE